jgi:UDP-4-keto-D-QuiNAc 4-reductase
MSGLDKNSDLPRVLITGANGFVGRTLGETLAQSGYLVRAAYRNEQRAPVGNLESVLVGDITGSTDWTAALDGVDAVIHCAARAHVLSDDPRNSELYMETNARGTRQLAQAAVRASVRRFIYLSSVKVNGEETIGRAYTAEDVPQPRDPYGTSKWLGEKYLAEVAADTSMETAIVRSPLVYGPGVRANFLRLMRWVDKGVLLPLGTINNRRSLVSVWNLCDLLILLLKNTSTPGRTWMVSDCDDVSTATLVQRIGKAMNRPVRLLSVPPGLLRALGALTGKGAEVRRLCGSLVLDTARTRSELGWTPPLTMEQALERTVSWYLSGQSNGH